MTTSSANLLTAFETLLCHVKTELLTESLALLIRELRKRPDRNSIFSIWEIDDVSFRRPEFTDEQCRAVLHTIEDQHDAEIGINWDVIDTVAEILYPYTAECLHSERNSPEKS